MLSGCSSWKVPPRSIDRCLCSCVIARTDQAACLSGLQFGQRRPKDAVGQGVDSDIVRDRTDGIRTADQLPVMPRYNMQHSQSWARDTSEESVQPKPALLRCTKLAATPAPADDISRNYAGASGCGTRPTETIVQSQWATPLRWLARNWHQRPRPSIGGSNADSRAKSCTDKPLPKCGATTFNFTSPTSAQQGEKPEQSKRNRGGLGKVHRRSRRDWHRLP